MTINSIVRIGITGTAEAMLAEEMFKGSDRTTALKLVLRRIGSVIFPPNGQAVRHLDHFLGNSGNPIDIDLNDLLKDPNVFKRLNDEIVRRSLKFSTIVEKSLEGTGLVDDLSEITIFQNTYANKDWKNALGTFSFKFQVVKVPSIPEKIEGTIVVKLWASNEYRWYPDEDRISKIVHQFADELVQLKKSASFSMNITPRYYLVPITKSSLVQAMSGVRSNPIGAGVPLSQQVSKWLELAGQLIQGK